MSGRVVFEEENLLHILAMISLLPGEAKEPLFQNGIALVPKCESKTKPLPGIGDAADAVFTPAVGAGAGLVVREVPPRVAIG